MAQPDDELVPVFIPSLTVLLLHFEQKKGKPLTEAEVLSIRDNATIVMMHRSGADELATSRGYDDLDPERAWEEWQGVRRQLA